MSHLTRGAWIEIICYYNYRDNRRLSHLTRGAWIEIDIVLPLSFINLLSHLTRGAWIEIGFKKQMEEEMAKVAPHTRCVD